MVHSAFFFAFNLSSPTRNVSEDKNLVNTSRALRLGSYESQMLPTVHLCPSGQSFWNCLRKFDSVSFYWTSVAWCFFGIAISTAIQKSSTPLSIGQQFLVTAFFTLGHLVAIFIYLFSIRVLGSGQTVCHGAIAGATGGLLVALGLFKANRDRAGTLRMTLIPAAGALLGATFTSLTIFLNDHACLTPPLPALLTYPIWQGGMAATISWCWNGLTIEEIEEMGQSSPSRISFASLATKPAPLNRNT